MRRYSCSACSSLPNQVRTRARHERTSMSCGERATSASTMRIAEFQSCFSAYLRISACHVEGDTCPTDGEIYKATPINRPQLTMHSLRINSLQSRENSIKTRARSVCPLNDENWARYVRRRYGGN